MYSTSSPILRVDLLPEATLCEKALKHLMQSRVRLSCPGLLLAATYIHTTQHTASGLYRFMCKPTKFTF